MKRLALILIAGLIVAPSLDARAPTYARVYFLTPSPVNGPPVRAALADHTDWLRQQNDAWGWSVFQFVGGHNIGD